MRLIACVTCVTVLSLLAGCGGSNDSSASSTSSESAPGSQVASIARPPTISGSPATSATVGEPYLFQPLAADPNGQALSYSVSGKPAWAAFNPTDGALSGTPAASDVGSSGPIVISVSDGTLSAALAQFTLTVVAAVSPVSTGGTATISWSAPTTNTDGTPIQDLAGYALRYGTSATALDQTVEISSPAATSYVVTQLAGGTWYFSVTSVNSAGIESAPSPVVSDTVS